MHVLREVHGVRYALLGPGDLDEMAVLLAEAFGQHEPMAVVSGYTQDELVAFVKLFGPKAVSESLDVDIDIARSSLALPGLG